MNAQNTIQPIDGYSNQIGILVSMMDTVRRATLDMTINLTKEQLDFNFDETSNSIGTLLFHISAMEYMYQVKFLENRSLNEREIRKWENGMAGNMIKRNVHGNNISYYHQELLEIRKKTLWHLNVKDDKWLDSMVQIGPDIRANIFYMLFHLMEDEIRHQGQVKLILNRFPSKPISTIR
jgi:uncharacterized damage-inducible protein DinB